MEFVEGDTLESLIAEQRPLSLLKRLHLLEDLGFALAFAHAGGVVHRDIKPSNLMIDEAGRLKILDFGIAKIQGSSLTTTHSFAGSAGYMSPEQIAEEPVDGRADLFAAGVVAYELLSYRRAYPGGTAKMWKRVEDTRIDSLQTALPGIGRTADPIIAKALQRRPEDRYTTGLQFSEAIAELRREAEKLLSDATMAAPPAWRSDATRPADTVLRIPQRPPIDQTEIAPKIDVVSNGHRSVRLVAVGLALCATGVGYWFWPESRKPAQQEQEVGATAGGSDSLLPAGDRAAVARRTEKTQPLGGRGKPATTAAKPDVPIERGGDPVPAAEAVPLASQVRPAPPAQIEAETKAVADRPTAPPFAVVPNTSKASETDTEIAAIRSVLSQFADAYRSKSTVGVKAVYPSMSQSEAAALDRTLIDLQSFRLVPEAFQVTVTGDQASAIGQVERKVVGPDGLRDLAGLGRFRFVRESGRWVISSVRLQ